MLATLVIKVIKAKQARLETMAQKGSLEVKATKVKKDNKAV